MGEAIYKVRDPTGAIREIKGPEGATDEQVIEQAKKLFSPPAAPAEASPVPADSAVAINAANKGIAGIPDALLNTPNKVINLAKAAYGTGATALGRPDLAPELTQDPNYASRAMKALGLTSEAAEPANSRQRIIDTMVQGVVGMAAGPASSGKQLVSNALTGMAGGGASGVTKEATGSDALATTVGMLAPSAAQAVGDRGRAKVAEAATRKSQNEIRDQTLEAARKEGYVIQPSTVNPSFVNKRLESIAGKAATGQEAAIRDQVVTNELAARDLGFPKGTAITEGKLEAFRDKVSAPYREVVALSPRAEIALEQLKRTRAEANAWSRHYDFSAHPDSLAAANALTQKAEVLEKSIEAIARRAGKPDLINELREARTKIAKSYDVERSLNLGTAGISAPMVGHMLDKGKPLTGDLRTIGLFAEAFPSVARPAERVPSPGVSKTEALVSSVAGASGAAAFGPAGAVAGGLPLLSGPTRSLILSKPYQKLMASPDYSEGKLLSKVPSATPKERALQALLLSRALAEKE